MQMCDILIQIAPDIVFAVFTHLTQVMAAFLCILFKDVLLKVTTVKKKNFPNSCLIEGLYHMRIRHTPSRWRHFFYLKSSAFICLLFLFFCVKYIHILT